MSSQNPHNTRSTSTSESAVASLKYSVNTALDQVKSEVKKVVAANKNTEKALQTIVNRLDTGKDDVSLLSMCKL